MRRMTIAELEAEATPTADKQSSAPMITSAAAILSKRFVPVRWVIPGLLPEGLTMLAARPKVGKSWLALDIAIAVATGGQVLGRPVTPGAALYLALEDNDRRLHARLQKLGAAGPGLERLHLATAWPRGEAGASAISEWIRATPDARFVAIDVFTKLRGERARSEQLYDADYRDVALLKPPPDAGVSSLTVHHTRKAEAADALDEVSGTLGIGGAVDALWVLKRARGEDEAVLHVIGRDIEEEGEFGLRFDRASCRWQWAGPAWQVRASGERREILEALAGGPMRPVEIAKALGKRGDAVRYLLGQMVDAGQVDRGLDGRYRRADPSRPSQP